MPAPETPWQGGGKMKWKMGNRLVLAGFVMATAILLFVGWQSYRNTARFAEASEWRDHTYKVLGNLEETVARLVDAETGQRGYLLTGEEAYLEPYREAIKDIDRTIGDLKNLTSDNPNQQKRIRILEPLVGKKLAKRHPNAILLDINLGAENGLDLVAWMRQKPEMREIPVIAVTAHALVTEQERILQAGCKACLSKPINFQALREQLNHWLQDRPVSQPNS
jgi:CheY-like chemotaxis protein